MQGGPQSLSGRYGEKKNLFPIQGIEPDSSAIQPIARLNNDSCPLRNWTRTVYKTLIATVS
jgi:hypothetical protein